MKLLITGCGRSSTKRVSQIFKSAGFSTGHEEAVSYSGIHPVLYKENDVEVSWLVPAYIDTIRKRYLGVPILHLMRHPLSIAASFKKLDFFNPRSIGAHLSTVKSILGDVTKSTHPELDYVIGWTKLVESIRTDVIKAEDINTVEDVYKLFNLADSTHIVPVDEVALTLGVRGVNSVGKPEPYSYDGYNCMDDLKELCNRYGYTL